MSSSLLRLQDYMPAVAGQNLLDRPIRYSLPAGSILGVTGPSGCGKSTMVRAIADAIAGQAKRNPSIEAARVVWDYLPQHDSLPPWYSPSQTISALLGGDAKSVLAAHADVIEALEVKNEISKPFSSLSGGERQRIAMLTLLVLEPQAILVDEPFTALDINKKGRALVSMMGRLRERNCGGIIVSHDLDVLSFVSDEVMIFNADRSGIEVCKNTSARPAEWIEYIERKRAGDYNNLLSAITGVSP